MARPRAIARWMLRTAARLFLALTLGAIVAVAVAIWAANSDRPAKMGWMRTPGSTVVPPGSAQAIGYRLTTSATFYPQSLPGDRGAQVDAWLALIPDADLQRFVRPLLEDPSSQLRVESAGWPLHSLACHYRYVLRQNRLTLAEQSEMFLQVPWLGKVGVPTRPLWRNFAADAAFFGAPFFLIMLAIAPLRAWRRRRKGLCPRCAYDLKGGLAAGCPECGWNRESAEPSVRA